GELPLDACPIQARPARAPDGEGLPPPAARVWPRSSDALTRAFREGTTSPRAIAQRVLDELRALSSRRPTMNVLAASDPAATLRHAQAATERWSAGRPLGPLDGVPFLVKDELDVAGLPTRLGSPCEPDSPAERDSTVVERLRRAGAVVVGKTVLTEW